MVWFIVDDGLATSPKVLGIPRAERIPAMGLWVLAGSWCGQHLTDGAVPQFMVEELGANESIAAVLVAAGLWNATAKGYQFKNWNEYQQLKSEVESKREYEREKKRRQRRGVNGAFAKTPDGKGSSPGGVPAGVPKGVPGDIGGESPGESHRPSPTKPNQAKPIENPSSPDGEDAFEIFYRRYPRKVGKAAAKKKFEVLAKKTSAELIIAGAARFAADPNLPQDKNFIPHPATWLNQGRWEDEPLPPRIGEISRADTRNINNVALVDEYRRREIEEV